MAILATLINLLYYAFLILILARVIVSWTRMSPYDNQLVRWVYELTEPVLQPIRRILPPTAGLDLSPLIALLLLGALRQILFGLIF